MSIAISVLLFVVGLVLIIKGGDFFVDAASWIAEVSGVPKIIVGATVVSIATTLPEIIVSCLAAAQGKVDMSVGNAVGSVTANTALIMAVSFIFMPAIINRKDYAFKTFLLLLSTGFLVIAGIQGKLTLFGSAFLFIIFIIFIWDNVSSANKVLKAQRSDSSQTEIREKPTKKTVFINSAKFLFGAAGIVGGAQLLVKYGSELASLIGISEAVISVTMIAVGTSLPELVTTITAVAKKQNELSVGNIIGANIIDMTLILPICSFIYSGSLPISRQSAFLDLPVCFIAAAVGLVPVLASKKITRVNGAALLAVYIAYMVLTFIFFV